MALFRTTYSSDEFVELIKNKINENNENKPTNWSEGSIATAIVNTIAYICTFLQLQINITYMAISRVATAIGLHLDRKMSDYGLARKDSTYAIAKVEFTGDDNRTQTVLIPENTVMHTSEDSFGNTIRFELSSNLILTTGATTVTGYAICTKKGTIGNISADTLTNLATPIVGIDSVTNLEDITNGTNTETDEAFRQRLPDYLLGLKRANKSAIIASALSVEGIAYAEIEENTPNNGTFSLFITTSDGIVDNILKSKVKDEVDKVRAFCVTPNIIAPSVSGVTISFDVSLNSDDYSTERLTLFLKNKLREYVNYKARNYLYLSDLIREASKVDGVNYVDNMKINNIEENLILNKLYVIKITDNTNININLV